MDDLNRILAKLKISELNMMQQQVLAAYNENHDIILVAQTGSGKTLAFLLPILKSISENNKKAIIIAPSRELVLQIEGVARTMAMGVAINVCYGGHPMRTETTSLKGGYQLVIGTPGRLADHIRRENIRGNDFTYCVLDEFDKSLEIGFHDEMKEIVESLSALQRYILTSATQAVSIPKFVNLSNEKRINDEHDRIKPRLKQWIVKSPHKDKLSSLAELIQGLLPDSMIVFANYKESVERIHDFLIEKNISNDFFHGGLDQKQRELVLSKFRNGSTQILVSTDLAARGLDIPIVANVIHYHLPHSEEEFIHRNGRTARMGATGNSFILHFEEDNLPEYILPGLEVYFPSDMSNDKQENKWVTIKLNRGKKDKISKSDIVGFLCKSCGLSNDNIGNIEVKDTSSLVAIHEQFSTNVINPKAELTLKGKKVRTEIV